MALHSGIDTVSFVSGGVYSETYGATDGANIASLFVSRGLLETAPTPLIGKLRGQISWLLYYLIRR